MIHAEHSWRGLHVAQVSPSRYRQLKTLATNLSFQLVGGAPGDHAAQINDDNLVGQMIGFIQLLAGEYDRRARGGEAADDLLHRQAPARVKPGGRLVREEHRRRHNQAGRQIEAAAHPSRVGLDGAPGSLDQVKAFKELVGPPGAGWPA